MLSSKGIVTDIKREILHIFSNVPDAESFYSSGGTALADFYLAYRKSFDLDLFTLENGLILPFSAS